MCGISGLQEGRILVKQLVYLKISSVTVKPDDAAFGRLIKKNGLTESRANNKLNKAAIARVTKLCNYGYLTDRLFKTLTNDEIKKLKAEDLGRLCFISLLDYQHKIIYYKAL
jgi:hypothetical protein